MHKDAFFFTGGTGLNTAAENGGFSGYLRALGDKFAEGLWTRAWDRTRGMGLR